MWASGEEDGLVAEESGLSGTQGGPAKGIQCGPEPARKAGPWAEHGGPLQLHIGMSTELLLRAPNFSEQQIRIISQIENSAARIRQIVNSLLDITLLHLGEGISINPVPMNMGHAAKRAVDEIQAANPTDSTIIFKASGNLDGHWDVTRMGQVFSNLMSNATRYKAPGSPVTMIWKMG